MGCRAIVHFYQRRGDHVQLGPAVYLHWDGDRVKELLLKAQDRLRRNDVEYSTARFVGVCHEEIDGNTGVGTWSAPASVDDLRDSDYSHGDAGVFLVNVESGAVEHLEDSGFGFDGAEPPELILFA